MRPPLDLNLPKSRRRPLVALAVSVALHLVLVLFGVLEPLMPRAPVRPVLVPPFVPDTTPLVFLEAPRREPLPPSRARAPRRPKQPQDQNPFVAALPEQIPQRNVPPVDTAAAPTPTPAADPAAPIAGLGRIGPKLGDGKLWVQPLPLPPRELAQRLARTHVELVDSAVTSIVQMFLDSIANDPGSRAAPLPDWTTRVAGKKFGLDSSSIYIAGLKIPAAVLALLPIPAGNIDQNRAYNRLLDLRADIQQAARRADNLAEFKERIREIRLRKEREEEFERSRKDVPASERGRTPEPAPEPRDSTAKTEKDKK